MNKSTVASLASLAWVRAHGCNTLNGVAAQKGEFDRHPVLLAITPPAVFFEISQVEAMLLG